MATIDEVKVLGSWVSPYVIRARIALNLKGVGYEFLQETFGTQERAAPQIQPCLQEDARPHPQRQAHLRVHDHRRVHRRVLVRLWPRPTPRRPLRPRHRPLPRLIPRLIPINLGLIVVFLQWFSGVMAFVMAQTQEAMGEAADQLAAGLLLLEEAFGKCSKGKGFFGGDSIGYLDIAIGSCLGWIRAVGKMAGIEYLDQGKTPLLARWAERFCSDAAVKELMPEVHKIVEYAEMVRATFKDAPPAN